MTAAGPWTCPSCKVEVSTPFCPRCGERPLRPRDLTLRGIVEMVFVTLSSIDDRLIRSFRLLATRPGALTLAYRSGQRRPFIGPLALFLVANVVFFAVQSLAQVKVFSTTLDTHLHGMFWADLAEAMVSRRLGPSKQDLGGYAPLFDQAIAANAKSMIGLMVPLMALLTALLFSRAREPLAVHVVFSLHYHAFMLLLICLPLAAIAVSGGLGGPEVFSPAVDDAVSLGLWGAVSIYLHIAAGKVYGGRGALRVATTAALSSAAAVFFLAYRFVLLPITLFSA